MAQDTEKPTAAEQIKKFSDAMRGANEAFAATGRRVTQAIGRANHSREAVEALATHLRERDWPEHPSVRTSTARRYEYRRLAAAIIAGEAWAIRKAWPEAAVEIKERDWRGVTQ